MLKEFTVNYDLEQDLKSTLFQKLDLDDDTEIIKKSPGTLEIRLGNIVITANKTNEWRSHWEFEYENQKYKNFGERENFQEMIDLIIKRIYNDKALLKKKIQYFDYHHRFKTSEKSRAGMKDKEQIQQLYAELPPEEREEIMAFWNEHMPAKFTEIDKFNGYMGV